MTSMKDIEEKYKDSWLWSDEEKDLKHSDDILDELEDYDGHSPWLPKREAFDRDKYVDRIWKGAGFGSTPTGDAIAAHAIVQTFVNAFSRDGRRVRIVFDKQHATAETDMNTLIVRITAAPLYDTSLNVHEKGRILTGIAVHEICHPRYGMQTFKAARRAFPNSQTAQGLSGLLDESRIENRYVEEYPGYSGIFKPTHAYVGRDIVGTKLSRHPVSIAIAAVRFADKYDWQKLGLVKERDWWQAWNAKWGNEDAPRRHVEGVREGLRHVMEFRPKRIRVTDNVEDADMTLSPPADEDWDDNVEPSGDGDESTASGDLDASSDGSQEGTDADAPATDTPDSDGQDATDEAAPEKTPEEMSDAELDEALRDLEQSELKNEPMLAACVSNEAIDEAADKAGVYVSTWDQQSIQDAIDRAAEYEDGVHVSRSLNKLIRSKWTRRTPPPGLAARFVRDALMQSRTGHDNISRYRRHGRVDSHGLHRVVRNDFRVFEKKAAESPGRYLIWLMVDHSGSMDGAPAEQVSEVARTIAAASQHVDSIRVEVWYWTDAFKRNTTGPGVALAWRQGLPLSDLTKAIDLDMGGTPDGPVFDWASRAIQRSARKGETPVILMLSDGQGYLRPEQINRARNQGVVVKSVAIGTWLREDEQAKTYGPKNYITWQGSIIQTARPLARMLSQIVSGRL